MTTVNARPGLLSRAKLAEPVRLYLHSVGAVLIAGLVLMGYFTDEWAAYLTGALAVVLAVGGGGEAARASVYSPRSMLEGLTRSRGSWEVRDHAA
jgi:hypothetical protein